MFIHKFTYPNNHVSVRHYTWSSQVKNQQEKIFSQFKNQGINISNIIEITESQQEQGKK